MKIEEQILLAPHTTFRLGGPARFFVEVHSVEELREALAFAKEKGLNVFLLGGGSNVLFADEGFEGLVIKLDLKGVAQEGEMLVAAAGEEWDALVLRAVADGLWGIENLSGIPGSCGAAPVQNIGAYGAELKDTLVWVEALELSTGELRKFSNAECGFGYRTSIFKREGGFVIVRVALQLVRGGSPRTSYKDLRGMEGASLQEVRQKVLAVRAQKFPDLGQEGTAGSFFLNPVVSQEKAAELLAAHPELPQFNTEEGVKLSLAWLFDHVLQLKGMQVGGARVFERQPLVLVASRNARASEVRALALQIKDISSQKLGIALEEEVRIIA